MKIFPPAIPACGQLVRGICGEIIMYKESDIMNTALHIMVTKIWWLDNKFERCDAAVGHLAVNVSTHHPDKNKIGSPQVERTDNEVK